jgi:hypothetical protein
MKNRKKLVGIMTAVLLVGGVALAAWTATGTGSGYAQATSAEALTTSVATTVGDLYPNGQGDLEITINNPNDYPVAVTSIASSGPAVTSPTDAACDLATGVSLTTQNGSWYVAANGSTTLDLDNAVSMSNASDNACQGKKFVIPVTLGGASTAPTTTTAP